MNRNNNVPDLYSNVTRIDHEYGLGMASCVDLGQRRPMRDPTTSGGVQGPLYDNQPYHSYLRFEAAPRPMDNALAMILPGPCTGEFDSTIRRLALTTSFPRERCTCGNKRPMAPKDVAKSQKITLSLVSPLYCEEFYLDVHAPYL